VSTARTAAGDEKSFMREVPRLIDDEESVLHVALGIVDAGTRGMDQAKRMWERW
jgi:hypothetical protein